MCAPHALGQKVSYCYAPMFTRMSMRPQSSTVFSMACWTLFSSVTSTWTTSEIPPSASIISFVSCAHCTLKSRRATLAPWRASKMAQARPFPISPVKRQHECLPSSISNRVAVPLILEPAPLTMATSPSKRRTGAGGLVILSQEMEKSVGSVSG